jgi:hypothetical protein
MVTTKKEEKQTPATSTRHNIDIFIEVTAIMLTMR